MRRLLPLFTLLVLAAPAGATGLLIPVEKKLPPLAMLNHQVAITIDDQVALRHRNVRGAHRRVPFTKVIARQLSATGCTAGRSSAARAGSGSAVQTR